jgi:hypothetical protein
MTMLERLRKHTGIQEDITHPLKHAENSAKKFGGKDYLPIHNWFDESKALFADLRLIWPPNRPLVYCLCQMESAGEPSGTAWLTWYEWGMKIQ